MSLETVSNIFSESTRLTAVAEFSPYPEERADAIRQLRDIRHVLDARTRLAEAAMRAGERCRVEVAALRAALAMLSEELHYIEDAESVRTPKPARGLSINKSEPT